ncbi:hypothetical protein GGR53DRAFT_530483 [Hypoxylon sp. FL1150]|nr:hypothetical protein GGR53DRAFT_530483 [Hypoxylon sp. FL1150]
MRFSRALESSPHSGPSPDGQLIAILLPSSIVVRDVKSLEISRIIDLPQDLTGGVTYFIWSPCSARILVAVTDQIHVFSVRGDNFHGNVRIPPSPAKSTFISFGPTGREICIWSPFGVKLTLIDLTTSKAVEIANPKFYHAASAARGYSFRTAAHHLALLTRTSGKDMISIHSPVTREVERSWYPDTIDAQGLAWTPDGRWLVVWESSVQAPRVLFYTSDGHIFKDWRGPLQHAPRDKGLPSGAGVRAVTISPDGRYAVIANVSTCLCVLSIPSMAEALRLRHPPVVQPRDTLQIWQEQSTLPSTGSFSSPKFVKAAQAVTPQWTNMNSLQDPISGCNLAKFDISSSLLATRLDDAPGTIWIWDIPSSDLRAVLMFHADVTKLEWHPVQPELLLIRCEGGAYGGLVFIWDPLSHGPLSIDMEHKIPGAVGNKTHATWLWLKTTTESAAIFFTNTTTCMITSLADSDEEPLPWQDGSATTYPINHKGDAAMQSSGLALPTEDAENSIVLDSDDDTGELDDTFQFQKFTTH